MNISNAFKQFPQLETENLILRETKLSDAPAIFEIFTNEDGFKISRR
jgi:[ribosomal protein S5]-alanine N-acetyltransferase